MPDALVQLRRAPHFNRDGGRASGIGGGEHSKGFWNKVAKEPMHAPGACWNWAGYLDRNGYGKFCTVIGGKVRTLRPHRHAWLLVHGEVLPPTIFLLHLCDNPRCCNPDHLRPGTQKENIRDCIEKGRFKRPQPHLFGERNAAAVLDANRVIFIRAHASVRGARPVMARLLGVHPETVKAAIYRRTWPHLPAEPWPEPLTLAELKALAEVVLG